jgi:hypothetical protein
MCWLCLADYDPIRQDGNHRHKPTCTYYAAYSSEEEEQAAAEQARVEAAAEQARVEAAAEQARVEAAAEQARVEATAEQTRVEAAAEQARVEQLHAKMEAEEQAVMCGYASDIEIARCRHRRGQLEQARMDAAAGQTRLKGEVGGSANRGQVGDDSYVHLTLVFLLETLPLLCPLDEEAMAAAWSDEEDDEEVTPGEAEAEAATEAANQARREAVVVLARREAVELNFKVPAATLQSPECTDYRVDLVPGGCNLWCVQVRSHQGRTRLPTTWQASTQMHLRSKGADDVRPNTGPQLCTADGSLRRLPTRPDWRKLWRVQVWFCQGWALARGAGAKGKRKKEGMEGRGRHCHGCTARKTDFPRGLLLLFAGVWSRAIDTISAAALVLCVFQAAVLSRANNRALATN